MNAENADFKYLKLTEKIIEIYYRVYSKLVYGFLARCMRKVLINKAIICVYQR